MSLTYDYFISYARRDNNGGFIDEFVERLENSPEFEELLGRKPRVFFDKEPICDADAWERKTRAGIAASRFMILFLSPTYFQSEYCAREFVWQSDRETRSSVFGEGAALIQIDETPELSLDGEVDLPYCIRVDFPRWTSSLRERLSSSGFDLTSRDATQIDDALAALCRQSRDNVWRQAAAARAPRDRSYPGLSENFVGRCEELRLLRKNLESRRRAALYGPGGAGKTDLALAYGHAFAWDYRLGRVYVDCKNQNSFIKATLSSVLELADGGELGGGETEPLEAIFDALSRRREEIVSENKENGRPESWGTRLLLILDDVTDRELLNQEELERLPEFVHLVAATRARPSDFAPLFGQPVDALRQSDALEFLRALRPFDDYSEREAAAAIVRNCGGHAFRLKKIGKYLRDVESEPYQDFLAKTRDGLGSLRKRIGAEFQPHDQAADDERLLRPTLERLTPNAKTLLDWAALFGPDSVAVPWLGELARLDGDDLRASLQELEDYRLLVPAEADYGAETPGRLTDAAPARLHHVAREIVVEDMPDDFRLPAIERISEKADEFLSKDARRRRSEEEDVPWELDSIEAFYHDRYLEAKQGEASEKDRVLIRRLDRLREKLPNYRAADIREASVELSRRWADAAPDDLDALVNLSDAWDCLDAREQPGWRLRRRGEEFVKALEIRKKIVELMPDDRQALRKLSVSYDNLGVLAEEEGKRKRASEYYEQALELRKKLVERTPDDVEALRELCASYDALGALSNAAGARARAREYCEKKIEALEKSVERQPGLRWALEELSLSYCRLGVLSKAEGERKQALECFEKELEIQKKVVEQTPDDLQALRYLCVSYEYLGRESNAEGARVRAREYLTEALEIRKRIVELTPNDRQALRNLSDSYTRLSALSKEE